ncbi:hypothetical protein [Azoarcus olearius]|uniref:Uncharacterized protein n=1 Tax=Azoarcus sp. (strain BH72) TaxID=418699 RepID=A1KA41_AZOSB|nr:hypothetical protein [Azoarcus olearius]ANQ86243.1 hypothetical protein dqs_3215 [Azoarcus olearius]CAL95697.1 hypothetical protein predicted by Glimmer/Critica [Azoarcus olearius]
MNEFYVEKRANENDAHVVHKGNCPSLPEMSKLHFIGVRNNSSAPLREAAHYWYSASAPCPVCMAG